ncbi:ATP-dependent DNA helicase RecG [Candidatus Peregrinibacteria bacterium]|nr:ATP-dependent DNA helicase RecG [Candidatus Peregrinibacteria bacterium]
MDLKTPLDEVIRTKRDYIKALRDMNLHTVEDLLLYFPRTYEDLSESKPLLQVKDGEKVSLQGMLYGMKTVPTRNRRIKIIKAMFYDTYGNGAEVVWFNQPFVKRTVPMETDVTVSGTVKYQYGKATIQNPRVERMGEVQVHTAGMVPVYPQHEVITSKWLREKIHPLLYLTKEFEEVLPSEILDEEGLMGKGEAVKEVHFPTNQKRLERARDRLAYEELFLLQLHAVQRKQEWKQSREKDSLIKEVKMDVQFVKNFFSTLPFTPTNAQKVTIFEILSDFEKPYPMMRLLEGDVGSGKTVVAVTALLNAVLHGYQAAIMAPTEVLARQHADSIGQLIQNYEVKFPLKKPINIQLLIGSLKPKEKKVIQDGINNGQIDILVGTHALIQESVRFPRLGLAVVDEQHRFGVKQREVLMKQGSPHVLNMTATPIPRTLAMVAYGDHDLSVINEMPPGRQIIITKIVPPEHRVQVNRFIADKVQKGEQVYVICPLIDDSEKMEVKSVKAEYERLHTVFPDFKIGLLHGKLKSEEKEAVMRQFKEKEIDILVSTSVIEVGVDVPNATIMLIEGAERFGLSQLHQFRGRVGRGKKQSYCFLCPSPDAQGSYERLRAMVECPDGFKLAEIDLKLRGPGEVYGVRQSGIPDLKIANLANGVLVVRVRKAAEHMVESEKLDKHPVLKSMLVRLKKKMEKA